MMGRDVVCDDPCDVACVGRWDPPSTNTVPMATPMTTSVVPATILVRRTRARPSRRDCSAAPGSCRTMRGGADAGTGADRTGPPVAASSNTIVSRSSPPDLRRCSGRGGRGRRFTGPPRQHRAAAGRRIPFGARRPVVGPTGYAVALGAGGRRRPREWFRRGAALRSTTPAPRDRPCRLLSSVRHVAKGLQGVLVMLHRLAFVGSAVPRHPRHDRRHEGHHAEDHNRRHRYHSTERGGAWIPRVFTALPDGTALREGLPTRGRPPTGVRRFRPGLDPVSPASPVSPVDGEMEERSTAVRTGAWRGRRSRPAPVVEEGGGPVRPRWTVRVARP